MTGAGSCALRVGPRAVEWGQAIQGMAKASWGQCFSWKLEPGNWPNLSRTQAPLERGVQKVVSSPCELTM